MTDDPRPPWWRRRPLIVLATMLVVLALAGLGWLPSGSGHGPFRNWDLGRRMPLPGLVPTTPADSPMPASEGEAPAAGIPSRPDDADDLTVTHIFDGDTIEVADPATDERRRVRLIGIDTPEGTPAPECWADEARAHLSELLPEGSTVWAAPDTELHDRYGRELLYLWTVDRRFVNYELVAAGDAEALRIPPNTAHAELFAATQTEAEASGAGQWGACG
ncbi:thermonuclease family protein [Microbacterium sp. NEAU-LLC]|uniref:Thermonuclease family protein n=1 Tax=Microbacterium helvum TaxID=2773713 RepID=A0ABR8NRC1_9MICO|nr:thermonuclease family protein [Microbacterium helvum]MBD3943185.1 thermonuclease family protein [Microbacterium helvum]